MSGAWLGTFVLAALAFLAVMLALGIGMLFGREPLRGSCGAACTEGGARRSCGLRAGRGRATEEPV